ncbi:MAG: glyceraldehyde-3-phosphate dehydrogenase, partial [Colwellia sp.]
MTSHLEEQYQASWQERQTFAENMQPIIGQLFRNKGLEVSIYGRPLVNASAIDIIKAHKSVALHEESKLRLRESFPFIDALNKMDLAPARIDVGKLAYRYLFQGEANGLSIVQFLEKELVAINKNTDKQKPKDVVLYGFGRIGRLLARLLIERAGPSS